MPRPMAHQEAQVAPPSSGLALLYWFIPQAAAVAVLVSQVRTVGPVVPGLPIRILSPQAAQAGTPAPVVAAPEAVVAPVAEVESSVVSLDQRQADHSARVAAP